MSISIRTVLLLLSPVLMTIASCSGEQKIDGQKAIKANAAKKPRSGDVRDSHGCLTSQGYTWSEAKDSCIHLWEAGTELTATDRSEHVVIAILSDNKTEAEIFVPEESSFILVGSGNGTFANDSLTLTQNGKDLVLRKGGQAIYQTALPEPVQEVKRGRKAKPVAKKKVRR